LPTSTTNAPLTVTQKTALRPWAKAATIVSTIFSGVAIALQVAILAPFPGTSGDLVMRALSFLAIFAVIATAFKVPEVLIMGPVIERRLKCGRVVRLKDVFNREIRSAAFYGGVLQAAYALMFTLLVPVLPPTALTAARACVIVPLLIVELFFGVVEKETPKLRLLSSLLVTLIGSAIVIFADGYHALAGIGSIYVWVLVALIVPGNFVLALAEVAEYNGVHKPKTSAAVYTLARFAAYLTACVTAVVVWGLTHPGRGEFSITWSVAEMCLHRWYFVLPFSLLWGLTDLARICSKPVVSATYMYVVGSLSVAIGTVTQLVAKLISPKLYAFVPGGVWFVTLCFVGGVIIMLGATLFPHISEPALQEVT
jgi:hypothetical protein